MAEGPVVHAWGRLVRRAVEGRSVDVTFGVAKLKRLEPSLRGVRVARVEVHGKQLRVRFGDGRLLLVHAMMFGFWRVYRRGAKWREAPARARVILRGSSADAIAFSTPLVKLFPAGAFAAEKRYADLGPDPLREDFSGADFLRRLDRDPRRPVGEALLDQRVIAGLGNILRIEVLHKAHVHPRRPVGSLNSRERRDILRLSREFPARWLAEGRRTEWVHIYDAAGRPCPVCGGNVVSFRQAGRITFACPQCQPPRGRRA